MKKLLPAFTAFFTLTVAHGQQGWYLQNSGTLKNLNSIFCIDSNTVIAAGDSGIILKTTDGGINWHTENSTATKTLRTIYFPNSLTGYAAGDSGLIVKTTDGGNTWHQQISHSKSQLSSMFFTSKDTGYILGILRPGFIKTTDGGSTWVADSTFGDCCMYLNSLTFLSKNRGFFIGYDMPGTLLFSTSNAGKTWEKCLVDPNWQWKGRALLVDSFPSGTGEIVAGTQSIIQSGSCNNWFDFGGGYGSTDFNSICSHKNPNGSGTSLAVGTNGIIGIYPNLGPINCCQLSGVTSGLNSIIFANSLIGYIAGDGGVILKTINGGLTGISEKQNGKSEIDISPNPFSTQAMLQSNIIFKNATLAVYNLYGQMVKQINNISGKTITLFRDNLPCGLYFIQITEDHMPSGQAGKIVATGKLVIADN